MLTIGAQILLQEVPTEAMSTEAIPGGLRMHVISPPLHTRIPEGVQMSEALDSGIMRSVGGGVDKSMQLYF